MKTEKRLVKIAIGCPTKGATDPTGFDNYLELMFHLGQLQVASELGVKKINTWTPDGTKEVELDYPDDVRFEFAITTVPRIFPALAREKIAQQAKESGMDYLFMFDDDMVMPKDIVERMYKHQKDIVAALAFSRLAPHHPVIYNLTEGFDAVEQKSYYINFPVLTYPKDTLVECDAVGFGAVLIDCKLFNKLKEPWFMTTSGAGEDVHFCWKAHDEGFRIYSDTTLKIGHLGERPIITEETYEETNDSKELRKTREDEYKYGKTITQKEDM